MTVSTSFKSVMSASLPPGALILAGLLLSPLSLAHEIAPEAVKPDAPRHAYEAPDNDLEFKLPSQAEIEAIKKQLPDMTAMMGDMMAMMQDEDMQKNLKGSFDILKDHVGPEDFAKTDEGLPDVTAMMGSMLDLMGDEDFIGGLIGAMEPLQQTLEKHMPDPEIAEPDWQ